MDIQPIYSPSPYNFRYRVLVSSPAPPVPSKRRGEPVEGCPLCLRALVVQDFEVAFEVAVAVCIYRSTLNVQRSTFSVLRRRFTRLRRAQKSPFLVPSCLSGSKAV